MIHVLASSGISPELAAQTDIPPEPAYLRFTVSGREDLQKLNAILNRALNTAPEFGEDWFVFSAKLEEFMAKNNIPRVASY